MNQEASDDVLKRVQLVLFEVLDALAEVGDGRVFEDFDDGFADFFHDAPDAAGGFVRASAFLVETFADAAYRGEGSFDVADDDGEFNFVGRLGEAITAGDAAFALNDPGGLEIVQDLFEEPFGDVLGLRDGLNADNLLAIFLAQDDECPQRIFASQR